MPVGCGRWGALGDVCDVCEVSEVCEVCEVLHLQRLLQLQGRGPAAGKSEGRVSWCRWGKGGQGWVMGLSGF